MRNPSYKTFLGNLAKKNSWIQGLSLSEKSPYIPISALTLPFRILRFLTYQPGIFGVHSLFRPTGIAFPAWWEGEPSAMEES
jgi:hypothetical protein